MLEWPVRSDFKSNLCDVHNLEHSTVYTIEENHHYYHGPRKYTAHYLI